MCVVIVDLYAQQAVLRSSSKSSQNSLVSFTGIANLNKEMYIDIFRLLRDAVRKKRPEKWRYNFLFLLHDNAATH
jgi:hypothetical protein